MLAISIGRRLGRKSQQHIIIQKLGIRNEYAFKVIRYILKSVLINFKQMVKSDTRWGLHLRFDDIQVYLLGYNPPIAFCLTYVYMCKYIHATPFTPFQCGYTNQVLTQLHRQQYVKLQAAAKFRKHKLFHAYRVTYTCGNSIRTYTCTNELKTPTTKQTATTSNK